MKAFMILQFGEVTPFEDLPRPLRDALPGFPSWRGPEQLMRQIRLGYPSPSPEAPPRARSMVLCGNNNEHVEALIVGHDGMVEQRSAMVSVLPFEQLYDGSTPTPYFLAVSQQTGIIYWDAV
jgi:hypothetical protein